MTTPIDSAGGAAFAARSGATARGTQGSSAKSASSPGEMSIDDFYKLLATQLRYQDADNPMDTSEMMAQMVQTQMISAITQMSQVNTITYAASMVGKEVQMAEIDSAGRFTGENTKGVISGMLMGDDPVLFVGDKGYHMSQIMTIGDVPDPPDPDKDPDEDPETGNTPDTNSPPE